MRKLPEFVARFIIFGHYHPVTAWRHYFGLTLKDLALAMNVGVEKIERIERSNLHLRADNLEKISKIFGIDKEWLEIRFNSTSSPIDMVFCNK